MTYNSRCGRRPVVTLVLGLMLLVLATPEALAQQAPPDDSILARAYLVRYRPLGDAAELVAPVLSAEGKVSLQPRLKTLVVVDRISVLERVAALLESFDLAPRDVELTLTLFMGTDDSKGQAGRGALPGGVSDAVVDVMEKIRQFMKWTSYEVLGSRSVNGIEGGRMTATLSDEYRVAFEIDSVDELQGRIRFRSFSVQKVIATADGGVRYQELYTLDDSVSPLGRLNLVGAASGPDSTRALFLTLQAELR